MLGCEDSLFTWSEVVVILGSMVFMVVVFGGSLLYREWRRGCKAIMQGDNEVLKGLHHDPSG